MAIGPPETLARFCLGKDAKKKMPTSSFIVASLTAIADEKARGCRPRCQAEAIKLELPLLASRAPSHPSLLSRMMAQQGRTRSHPRPLRHSRYLLCLPRPAHKRPKHDALRSVSSSGRRHQWTSTSRPSPPPCRRPPVLHRRSRCSSSSSITSGSSSSNNRHMMGLGFRVRISYL